MTATVHVLRKERRMTLPEELGALFHKLAHASGSGKVTGIAMVVFLDGHGYLAETHGEATTDLAQTRLLLKALDAKLAKRQLGARP